MHREEPLVLSLILHTYTFNTRLQIRNLIKKTSKDSGLPDIRVLD